MDRSHLPILRICEHNGNTQDNREAGRVAFGTGSQCECDSGVSVCFTSCQSAEQSGSGSTQSSCLLKDHIVLPRNLHSLSRDPS